MDQAGRLKSWVLLVGVVGLCGGFALGLATPHAYARVFPDIDGYPDVVRLHERYRLSPDQSRKILLVFHDREDRMMNLFRSVELPDELEQRLQAIYRQADDRIEAVLDSSQRAQYRKDRDSSLESANRREDRAKNR